MNAIFQSTALLLIQIYRWCISPFLPVACRFHPTCSEYARQAIEKHGVFKGGYLTFGRLLRCNPLGSHGEDEVPHTFCKYDK